MQGQVLTHTLSETAQRVHYNGLLHCFRTIQATEGLQGFYRVRCAMACVLVVVIVSALSLLCPSLIMSTITYVCLFCTLWLTISFLKTNFTQGIVATVAKSVVSTAITFAAYEVRFAE